MAPTGGAIDMSLSFRDDDQAIVARAGVVHGFISHARTHGAVTDDGNHIVVSAGEIACGCHAEAG